MVDEYCDKHSAQCVRLDHLERRVCMIEKLGVKILVGIAFNLIAVIGGIIMVYIKLHV